MNKTLFDIALTKHQSGDLEKAEKLYKQILQKEPNNADVLHLYGILCAQQMDYQSALKVLIKACTLAPNSPSFYNSLGNVYQKLGDLDKAAEVMQKAIHLQPNNATALSNLGNVLFQQKKYPAAKKHYEAALRQNPKLVAAYYNLALLAAKDASIDEAITHLNTTIQIDDNHERAHGLLGQLLQQQGQLEDAIKEQQKQIQIEPYDADAYLNLGSALIANGQALDAIPALKKSLEINKDNLDTWHNLAAAELQLKNYEEALKIYLNLIEQKPEPEYYFNIGVIYMDKDHHKNAIEYFKQALKLKPDDFDTYINLATTYLKQQDYQNSILYYKSAQKLQPDNQEIAYILTAIEEGKAPKTAPSDYIKNLFDQYAAHFDQHLQQHLNYHVPELLYQAVSQNKKLEKNSLKILDLGCGTGLTGIRFQAAATELIGIDLSEKMIATAKEKKIYDRLEVTDIEAALKQYTDLDLILAGDVFSYVGDLETIFALSKKALKEKGLFAFTTEICFDEDYTLQKSARYAHSSLYLTQLAEKYHFQINQIDNAILRTQLGKPLEGYVVLLTNLQSKPQNAE